jgi:hypothetical protein
MPSPHPHASREPFVKADGDSQLGKILLDRSYQAAGRGVGLEGLAPKFKPEDG